MLRRAQRAEYASCDTRGVTAASFISRLVKDPPRISFLNPDIHFMICSYLPLRCVTTTGSSSTQSSFAQQPAYSRSKYLLRAKLRLDQNVIFALCPTLFPLPSGALSCMQMDRSNNVYICATLRSMGICIARDVAIIVSDLTLLRQMCWQWWNQNRGLIRGGHTSLPLLRSNIYVAISFLGITDSAEYRFSR